MANFLCAVSGKYPENYQIGLQAGIWGVEEKYEAKIGRCRIGDVLVFVVGGSARSIHTVESDVFVDNEPLWPPKDGGNFPIRIKIGQAVNTGDVPLQEVSKQISFMQGKV